jgi:hypothetical protein
MGGWRGDGGMEGEGRGGGHSFAFDELVLGDSCGLLVQEAVLAEAHKDVLIPAPPEIGSMTSHKLKPNRFSPKARHESRQGRTRESGCASACADAAGGWNRNGKSQYSRFCKAVCLNELEPHLLRLAGELGQHLGVALLHLTLLPRWRHAVGVEVPPKFLPGTTTASRNRYTRKPRRPRARALACVSAPPLCFGCTCG